MPTATKQGSGVESITISHVDSATGEVLGEATLTKDALPRIDAALRDTIYDPDRDQPTLPGFEGFQVDAIEVAFTGTLALSMHEPDDVALFEQLTMGADVSLRVEGVVLKVAHSTKEPGSGRVTRRATITITEIGA